MDNKSIVSPFFDSRCIFTQFYAHSYIYSVTVGSFRICTW